MPDLDSLPTHCLWCGVYLQGGATQHLPECWLSALNEWPAIQEDTLDQMAKLRAFQQSAIAKAFGVPARLLDNDCSCRTCGHVASSHIGGHCFECGREGCWT